MATPLDRVIIIVLDSAGCGSLPDADRYGDAGSNTIGNIARKLGGLELPNLGALGLGNLTEIPGTPPRQRTEGAYGKMGEASPGKDTTTGHWELAGLELDRAFPVFPQGFPPEILDPFVARTGRGYLANKPASGTEILDELGAEHMRTGKLIVYTSADSVFQIAAHEEVVPLPELYRASEIAREILDPYGVGRVIARPFVGAGPGQFKRTYNRKDFSLLPPGKTVLDHAHAAGLPVVGIGKISDIFAGHGVSESIHTEGNRDGIEHTRAAIARGGRGVVFTNLIDFDMLYGHRNDVAGYAAALREFDAALPSLRAALGPRDLLILTADHGNDPTWPGTDHTREHVPLLVAGPGVKPVDLGLRRTFADVGATVAAALGLPGQRGTSFLSEVLAC